jgi:hypothetical protein
MIRSNSNSAKAINLVAKNFNLTAKEIAHRNWCEDGLRT